MNERLLIQTKQESKKETFTELSKFFILNEKYQKLLFFIFSITIYTTSLVIVNFPSQKALPDYTCIKKDNKFPTDITHITSLPKYKIITDKACIIKHCHKNKDKIVNESEIIAKEFTGIAVDYTTIRNFVTVYDAFCDYEDFFINLNTLINFCRIIGNSLMGYLADKYGRKLSYFLHLYIMLLFYFGIFFFDSRAFFYLFIIFTSINIQFFQLLQVYSNETMPQLNFSYYSSLSSIIYTINGLICMLVMVFLKNFYLIYFIQLIFVISTYYLSNKYVKETLPFLIKKEKYNICLDNMKNLNEKLNLELNENSKY